MRAFGFVSVRATLAERSQQLPGDRFIPDARGVMTHAITIAARPQEIWPWLSQMGVGRGGWYSYDFVDNGGQPSATEILSEFQQIAPGDLFPTFPGVKNAFIVAVVDQERSLVLAVQDPGCEFCATWEFLLHTLDHSRTRLIVRVRVSAKWLDREASASPLAVGSQPVERVYALLAKIPWWLMFPFAAFGHHLMQARQLKGIKCRAEKR